MTASAISKIWNLFFRSIVFNFAIVASSEALSSKKKKKNLTPKKRIFKRDQIKLLSGKQKCTSQNPPLSIPFLLHTPEGHCIYLGTPKSTVEKHCFKEQKISERFKQSSHMMRYEFYQITGATV